MSERNAYLLRVRFNKIKSKYYNNIISISKCENVVKTECDNGRVIEAEQIEMTITDVDFYLILDCYDIGSYEILEAYSSTYKYLPIQFINFVLEKYVKKTEYKGVVR